MSTIRSYKFEEIAPAGFYVACRMGYVAPQEELNNFPDEWIQTYTAGGYMLYDPVIRWAYENTGHKRWDEVEKPDPQNILVQAQAYDLNFGLVASYRDTGEGAHRTFGSFARSDRAFTEAEVDALFTLLVELHNDRAPPTNLTAAELEVLAMLKQGMLMKQVAVELGVSESAIKGRLKNAKQKLSAKTNTHAASVASELGLI